MKAIDFSLQNKDGKYVKLSDFRGRFVVLYFYPKDDTSGCTLEARDFTSLSDEFKKIGCIVIGISPDSVDSHKKFCDKYSLDVELLSDKDKFVLKSYDVWKEKSMYGRKYMGVQRSTFIVDYDMNIIKEFRNVKVSNHAREVLDYLLSVKK